MRYLALLLLFPFTSSAMEELETKNYSITITSGCQEGEVSCSNFLYTGTSKASGQSIMLKGSSWHTLCADGVTPCRFLGYKFNNGNVTYFVGQNGLLEVIQNKNKLLLSEQGRWK